jgi:hypothetical protein
LLHASIYFDFLVSVGVKALRGTDRCDVITTWELIMPFWWAINL